MPNAANIRLTIQWIYFHWFTIVCPSAAIVLKLSAFQRNAVAGFPQMKVTQALQNLLNLKEIQ
jgi:hypothetical protein